MLTDWISNRKRPQTNYGYVVRVVDGDTIDCVVDLGYRCYQKERFRLSGIDACELSAKDEIEKQKALAAKDYLVRHILNKEVKILSIKEEKYGRWLAEISHNGININKLLIDVGLAAPI